MMQRFAYLLTVGSLLLSACGERPGPTDVSSPPPCTEIGQTWESPVDGAVLVCVPAGEFLMGASDQDEQAASVERPQHTVMLDAFWIDRTEVTNGQFAQCVAAGMCERHPNPGQTGVASRTRPDYYLNDEYANYPALVYQAFEAEGYCAWAQRRLPSEAEWEKAARGTDGRRYPWGDSPPACEIFNGGECYADTTEVASFPEGNSPYGAVDMAGNVWEWVADVFDPAYYADSPSANPTGPDGDGYRIRRGGGWNSFMKDQRSTRRAEGSPHHYFDGQMGLRCALDSP